MNLFLSHNEFLAEHWNKTLLSQSTTTKFGLEKITIPKNRNNTALKDFD
jgi:hypothetical protein